MGVPRGFYAGLLYMLVLSTVLDRAWASNSSPDGPGDEIPAMVAAGLAATLLTATATDNASTDEEDEEPGLQATEGDAAEQESGGGVGSKRI